MNEKQRTSMNFLQEKLSMLGFVCKKNQSGRLSHFEYQKQIALLISKVH